MRKGSIIILNEVGQFVKGLFVPKGRIRIDKNPHQSKPSLEGSYIIIKKGFTLIEIVIVLITAAILIGILFRVYTTTADIAMRIKHQKQLGMGVVTMQTVLQNIVDTHTIDYNAMTGYTRNTTPGWTNIVPLVDESMQKSTIQINGSGELVYTTYSGGALVGSASILGIDVTFSGATFIVYPYRDPKIDWCTAPTIQCFKEINHPGFWLIGKLYSKNYTQLYLPIHTFFSFLKK